MNTPTSRLPVFPSNVSLRNLCLFAAALFVSASSPAQSVAQVGFPQMNWETAVEKLIRDVLVPGGVDEKVIDAIRKTPRHEFLPPAMRRDAYADTALPIGARQTISSPYIVSIMTQELDVAPTHKVLEIGTGSGYQAAVLSPLAKEVYSIEIVPELGKKAARVLTRLGYKNVFTKIGDGFKGWPEHAPFDRIIVTCSPEDVPQPLTDQLVEDGLIVVPTGERYQQTLYLMRKKNGKLEREALRPTLFVPMTGQAEENRKVLPDPARPVLFNGDFEEPLADNGYLPGWYYQQNLTLMKATDEDKADGTYARFENDTRGQPAHLLQGLALDGRVVKKIELSASMRFKDIRPGLDATEQPAVMIRFYDSLRGLIDSQIIRPRRGRSNWQEIKRVFRVPKNSREAIVSLGLFGASGTADFDNLELSPSE